MSEERERYSEAKALLERRKKESIPWFANPLKFSETNSEGYALVERKHESTTIELFYDLFFVGNLTTFTYVHEINDIKSFRSYTGFFTIIWFTWLQTALFDCRFARDSVLERIFKFIQFGVMIGFAAVGSDFRPNEAGGFKSFRAVSVILLVSQLLLAVQYITILIAVIKRRHKSAVTPLAMIIAIYFITAMVFLGLNFTFRNDKKGEKRPKTYVAWYVALILETCAITGVALWRRILSFKFSNIVERMGLLTLIILGEGVIGLAKTANKIIYKEGWTPSCIWEVTAYTGTIFFMWMLYFDYNPRTHYGSIRQQIWTLLHYPFHLACVLLPEGFGNMVIWRNIVNQISALATLFKDSVLTTDTKVPINGSGLINMEKLTNGTQKILKIKEVSISEEWDSLLPYLTKLENATTDTDFNSASEAFYFKVVGLVFKGFKVPLPESFTKENGAKAEESMKLEQYSETFRLVYAYFFGSAAAVVLLYAVFLFLVRKKSDKYDIISMFYRGFVGIGLICCTLITFHSASLEKIMLSPWFIPIVPFALGLLIAADRLLHYMAIRSASKSFGRVGNHKSGKSSPDTIDTHYNPTHNGNGPNKPMFSPQPAQAEDVGRGYYPMTDMTSNVMADSRPVDARIAHGPYSNGQPRNSRASRHGRPGYSDV